MTDTAARAAELLKGHRESIDRLDAVLVFTLGCLCHNRSKGI